jgi:plasmid stabilization system protein ParE
MRVIWSIESSEKIQSIKEYLLEEWTEDEFNAFLLKLRNFERLVVQYPNLYPVSSSEPSLRKAVLSKHQSVIYKIDGKIIRIITILDHRQNNKIR